MKMKVRLMLCLCAFVLMLTGSSVFASGKLTKPATVKKVTVENTEKGVKVTWEKAKGAAKYQVARSRSAHGKYTVIGTTTKLYYTDKRAKSGDQYYYKVRAVKVKGSKKVDGKYSKIHGIRRLSQVKEAKATVEDEKYSVTWKKVKGATAYQIEYSNNHIYHEEASMEFVSTERDNVVLKIPGKDLIMIRIRAVELKGQTVVNAGPWSPVLIFHHTGGEIILKKPVIYLYPEEEMGDLDVSVGLDLAGEFTCVYPSFDEASTWNVTASPDGTITKDGRKYRYLYWEGESDLVPDMANADCIPGSDTASYLDTTLEILGLNDAERDDFITYWLPQMEKNPYNLIAFQTENYTDAAKLTVSPQPDTMIRVYMCWHAMEEEVETAAMITPAPERSGFTVVEWGGSEV